MKIWPWQVIGILPAVSRCVALVSYHPLAKLSNFQTYNFFVTNVTRNLGSEIRVEMIEFERLNVVGWLFCIALSSSNFQFDQESRLSTRISASKIHQTIQNEVMTSDHGCTKKLWIMWTVTCAPPEWTYVQMCLEEEWVEMEEESPYTMIQRILLGLRVFYR